MSDRKDVRVRKVTRSEDGDRRDVAGLSPGERIGMMWQLALDAWTFKGEGERAESGLQRDVVRIHRRGG